MRRVPLRDGTTKVAFKKSLLIDGAKILLHQKWPLNTYFFQMLYQEENPGVEFEYSLPSGSIKETPQGGEGYIWTTGPWAECTSSCGGGQKTRSIMCTLEVRYDFHKMSLITIFGHKHFRQKFHQKVDIFHEKIQQSLILVHIWNKIANFESKLLLKRRINFEETGCCGQKMLLLKYFKDYII